MLRLTPSFLPSLVFAFSLAFAPAASHAASAPWLPLGPDGGDARRLVADPRDPTHLYMGTATGWVYESHNAGDSWRRLARLDKRDDLVIDSLVVDKQNPSHLIVGAWVLDRPDGGLYTSNDAGVTWTSQPEMKGESVRAVAASASDPKVLVAGTLKGVFRSEDSGVHWKLISPADSREIHEIQSVAIDPKDTSIIYAGTWHLPWKTTDGGAHWDNIKKGIIDDSDVFSIIVDPVANQTLYASACSGIYKSIDSGLLFKKVQGIPSTARRTRVLLQDPHHPETVFAGTTEGLYRTQDSGATWKRTTGPEIIVNDVFIDARDSHRVLLATDRGGVITSADGGDTFHASNDGFSARQITAVQRDLTHPSTVYVGVVNDKTWGGIFESEDGGQKWSQQSNGLEGRDVFALGQAPGGALIAGTSHGLFRLEPTTHAWHKVEDVPIPVMAALYVSHASPASVRPSVPSSRPAQGGKVPAAKPHAKLAGKRGRRVAAPAKIETRPFDGSVYAIANGDKTLFAATSNGVLASVNDGASWKQVGAVDATEWTRVAANKQLVVAGSLHSAEMSRDAGATWTAMKLPESLTHLSAIAVDSTGAIWLGGREGVFVSSDGGGSWEVPKNLTVHSVNSLYYDESSNRVLVTQAAYANLVFEVQLPQKQVSFIDSGWHLRSAQPLGGHLIGATLFDGMVVQPDGAAPATQAAASAVTPASTSAATSATATTAH